MKWFAQSHTAGRRQNWYRQPDSRVFGGWAGVSAENSTAPHWPAERSRRANTLQTTPLRGSGQGLPCRPHLCVGEGGSLPSSPNLQDPRKTQGQARAAEEREADVKESSKSLHHVGLNNGAAHHFTRCWENH